MVVTDGHADHSDPERDRRDRDPADQSLGAGAPGGDPLGGSRRGGRNPRDPGGEEKPGGLILRARVRHPADQVSGLAAAQAADRVQGGRGDGLAGADLDDRAVADQPLALQLRGGPAAAGQPGQDVVIDNQEITSCLTG